jgi:hypothetical protein
MGGCEGDPDEASSVSDPYGRAAASHTVSDGASDDAVCLGAPATIGSVRDYPNGLADASTPLSTWPAASWRTPKSLAEAATSVFGLWVDG